MSESIVFPNRVALFASDEGARATLQSLCPFGAYWSMTAGNWAALVCGTSQSETGFALEAAARRLAAGRGIPIACIEDFPGNYREVEGAPTKLLVVEGAFSEQLYSARLKVPPPIAVVPPARYDPLRGAAPNPATDAPPYHVLWAGQPETRCCLTTLEALRSFLRSSDIEFLFRAHPRDPGYPTGAYRSLLESLAPRCKDVTATPLSQLLREPLHLVLTQFSSVAIDAGFLGIPSVHVLLPGAGADLLLAQKGYSVPMPCDAGAAFLVSGAGSLGVLQTALRDVSARQTVLARFRALYHADQPQAGRLAKCLADTIYT